MSGINKGIQKGIQTGVAQGTEKTMLQNIQNLMETMKWFEQQAIDALRVPKEDQARFNAMLGY